MTGRLITESHFQTTIHFFSGGSFEPRKTEPRNLNKAGWKPFRESLDMVEWPVIDEDSRLEDMAERFESLVEGALEKACP